MPNTIPVPYTEATIVIDVPLEGTLEIPVLSRTTTQELRPIVTKAAFVLGRVNFRKRQLIEIIRFEDLEIDGAK